MEVLKKILEFGLDHKFLLGLGLGLSYSIFKLLRNSNKNSIDSDDSELKNNAVRFEKKKNFIEIFFF